MTAAELSQFYSKLNSANQLEKNEGNVAAWKPNGEANPNFFLPNLNKPTKTKKNDSGLSGDSHSDSHSDNDNNKNGATLQKPPTPQPASPTIVLKRPKSNSGENVGGNFLHGGKKIRVERVTDESSEEQLIDVVGSDSHEDAFDSENRLSNPESQGSNELSSASASSRSSITQFHSLLSGTNNQLPLPSTTARQRLFVQAEKQRRRKNRREKIKTRLDELMKQVHYLQREYNRSSDTDADNSPQSTSSTESESCDAHAVNILSKISLPGFESTVMEQMVQAELANVIKRIQGHFYSRPKHKLKLNLSDAPMGSDGSNVVDSDPNSGTKSDSLTDKEKLLLSIQPTPVTVKTETVQPPAVPNSGLPTLPLPTPTPPPSLPHPAAARTPTLISPSRALSITVPQALTPLPTLSAQPSPTPSSNYANAYFQAQQNQASINNNTAVNNAAAQAYQQAYQKALLAAKLSQVQNVPSPRPMSLMSPLTGRGLYDINMDAVGSPFGNDYMDIYGNYHKEGLTPHHLKKAKLMFFYTRYPSSSVLKNYFTDVRFNRATTSQLIKWFSNFREFFYIHIEKLARTAVQEGVTKPELLTLSRDSELVRILNNHYNKSNQFEVPTEFIRVGETAMREFFSAIREGKDQDPSWKKVIYKVICKLDVEIPAKFKQPQMAELGD